jgi:hypothetical protein
VKEKNRKETRWTGFYANLALIYAVAAMVSGVFFREFTKFTQFTGQTRLSVMHTHYFMLGMFFFLILALAQKVLNFSDQKTGGVILAYQIGLNITAAAFLVRGLGQVQGTEWSKAMDASISGIAGIGHILTGISMILVLLKIKKSVMRETVG